MTISLENLNSGKTENSLESVNQSKLHSLCVRIHHKRVFQALVWSLPDCRRQSRGIRAPNMREMAGAIFSPTISERICCLQFHHLDESTLVRHKLHETAQY